MSIHPSLLISAMSLVRSRILIYDVSTTCCFRVPVPAWHIGGASTVMPGEDDIGSSISLRPTLPYTRWLSCHYHAPHCFSESKSGNDWRSWRAFANLIFPMRSTLICPEIHARSSQDSKGGSKKIIKDTLPNFALSLRQGPTDRTALHKHPNMVINRTCIPQRPLCLSTTSYCLLTRFVEDSVT
jgi:hypothetical protein